MTQKLFCLCVALLFAFVTLNVASAEEVVAGAADCPCPCVKVLPGYGCPAPCAFAPGCSAVSYRVGLFGVIRPVVYAPVYRPVYYPARFVRAPYCYPAPACCW